VCVCVCVCVLMFQFDARHNFIFSKVSTAAKFDIK